MAHHKRGRSKSQRAGSCTGRKRFKFNGMKGTAEARPVQEVRADQALQPDRNRKRTKDRKPWVVEYRTRPEILAEGDRGFWSWLNTPEWTVWRRYTTRAARDEAMRQFQKRQAAGDRYWPWRDCEFRATLDG